MPATPFPVIGKVYDLDGTTLLTSGIVYAWNKNNDERTSSSINASGEYSLDLANLTSGYDTGDVIYLYVMDSEKNAVIRAELDSGDDSWTQDLYMKTGELSLHECKINSVIVSNNSGGAISVSFVERTDEITKILINVDDNGTQSASMDERIGGGFRFNTGFFPIITSQGTNIYNQSAGVDNAIGDTATRATIIIMAHII